MLLGYGLAPIFKAVKRFARIHNIEPDPDVGQPTVYVSNALFLSELQCSLFIKFEYTKTPTQTRFTESRGNV